MQNRKIYLTIIIIALFILSSFPSTSSSNLKLFLLTKKKGILLSHNNGRDWEYFNQGLPQNYTPLKIYSASDTLYLTTRNAGIFKYTKNSNVWQNISSYDFRIRSQYMKSLKYRKISAFAVDPNNQKHIVCATKHTIYKSFNSGKTWTKIKTKGISGRNYITAIAVKDKNLYVGTSFNGFYKLHKGRFININKGLPKEPYSKTLSFVEEISHIAVNPKSKNIIYSGFAFGGGVYFNNSSRLWKKIKIPEIDDKFYNVHDIQIHKNSIYITLNNQVYKLHSQKTEIKRINYNKYLNDVPDNLSISSLFAVDTLNNYPPLFYHFNNYPKKNNSSLSSNKKAIYTSVYTAKKKLNSLISSIKKTKFNAIVIDMKDDFGKIFYPTKNKTAHEIRAARKLINISMILKRLKANNIYTIARIVVFKDEKLFRAYNNKYAIFNRRTGRPWRGNSKEFWVDPYSAFVRNYNIELAQELEASGFDEIQFDYIRFPSDGPTHLCLYKYKKNKEAYKSEILVDFLKLAKNKLSIPVSVDIYGFNSWYHFGNWIGQDMEEFSYIVDVICPMVYPSHFGNRFFMKGKRETRPYRIVYTGGMRARKIIDKPVSIRPYIQAFKMSSPTWGTGYIKYQIKASIDSGCSGFTFWNANGDYKTVVRAFKD